ncbi:hypothetical protein C0989_007382 [Termitomyces sp. Mn162]|nr:hypothetical protein C0989_007382 [Termitomyces sp. Mn162]
MDDTRPTILSSILRGRPRQSVDNVRQSVDNVRAVSTSPGSMLRRRRSGGTLPAAATHRIRLVPHIDSRRTLRFDAIARDLSPASPALRIGRFTDRTGLGLAAVNALGTNRLAFKSKVVSRAHAEIWVDSSGRFFIRDTKSSSGTFLNHVRLSPANTESRPFQMRDGDILQLGVDYQGGTEDIYKSVKIRIELGREWQAAANAFNTNTLNVLKTLQAAPPTAPKTQIPDCCICLFSVTIRQALFIAPCSHTFHYKCIRPLLETHHPAFSCPLCRTYADLEEDVEVEAEAEAEAEAEQAENDSEHPEHENDDSAEPDARESDDEPDAVDAHAAPAYVDETTPAPAPLPLSLSHTHAVIEEECAELRGTDVEDAGAGAGVSELGEVNVEMEVEVDTTVAGKQRDVVVVS